MNIAITNISFYGTGKNWNQYLHINSSHSPKPNKYKGMEIHWINLLLTIPLCIVLTCIATFGMGTLLAALNIKFRDFRYLIPFMIQTLFFITPVIYPISIVQSYSIKLLLSINPMYAAIELLRGSMTGIYPDLLQFVISLASSLIFLFPKSKS